MSAESVVNFIAGDKRQQIKSLLKQGIPAGQVAAAVCCEAGYISQLMMEEEFSKEVVEARFTALQSFTARDGRYDRLEDLLIEKLEQQMPMMMNPDRILRAITVINNAKRRGVQGDMPLQQVTQVINLTLPAVLVNKYKVNGSSEVIEVNGEALVGMPAKELLEKVKSSSDQASSQNQIQRASQEVVEERVGRLLDSKSKVKSNERPIGSQKLDPLGDDRRERAKLGLKDRIEAATVSADSV